MKTVFLDSAGLIAVWNVHDQWHKAADLAYRQLLAEPCRLVTTSYVLMECGNATARTTFRRNVFDLKEILEAGSDLIRPNIDDEDLAWLAFVRGDAGQAGIVDQISFSVMRQNGISDAFTNDRHFVAAGFTTLS